MRIERQDKEARIGSVHIHSCVSIHTTSPLSQSPSDRVTKQPQRSASQRAVCNVVYKSGHPNKPITDHTTICLKQPVATNMGSGMFGIDR